MIYFDQDLKKRVFELIDESLKPEGILVLGESEVPLVGEYRAIASDAKYKIYEKTSKEDS